MYIALNVDILGRDGGVYLQENDSDASNAWKQCRSICACNSRFGNKGRADKNCPSKESLTILVPREAWHCLESTSQHQSPRTGQTLDRLDMLQPGYLG
jgi:hypothetical protein